MLRTCSRIIALTAMVAGLSMTAQAAEPQTLTLACKGTATSGVEDAKPEPVSMGIIVNFTNRTVQGFGTPGMLDYPIKITAWNDVTVVFAGSLDYDGGGGVDYAAQLIAAALVEEVDPIVPVRRGLVRSSFILTHRFRKMAMSIGEAFMFRFLSRIFERPQANTTGMQWKRSVTLPDGSRRGRKQSDNQGRRGRCMDCGRIVELTEARIQFFEHDDDRDPHLHLYHCPKCAIKSSDGTCLYGGKLIGTDGFHIVDFEGDPNAKWRNVRSLVAKGGQRH
jgi:hypothetical protein